MSLQEIIVIAIVFFCVNYVGVRVVKYIQQVKKGKNPCESCVSGCELRDMMEKKKEECGKSNHRG